MCRLSAGVVGDAEGATTTDSVTVDNISCELINISNSKREMIGGESTLAVKQSILGKWDPDGQW